MAAHVVRNCSLFVGGGVVAVEVDVGVDGGLVRWLADCVQGAHARRPAFWSRAADYDASAKDAAASDRATGGADPLPVQVDCEETAGLLGRGGEIH